MSRNDIDIELELCCDIKYLEEVLNEKTNNGTIQDKYSILYNYMGILGSTANRDLISLEEEYLVLKESFIDGNWRAICGKY